MQTKLFDLIRAKHRNKNVFIERLQEVLNLGRSAVYKRLAGSVLLNAEEIGLLIQHFNIDPNALFGQGEGRITFSFPPLNHRVKNQKDFINILIGDMALLMDDPNSRFDFLATGFPIFCFFFHKEIAHFKFYTFQNSLWKGDNAAINKFQINGVAQDRERIAMYDQIKQMYASLDTEEVWTGNMLETTVHEIRAYVEAGMFSNPEDALQLMDLLENTVDQIARMVRAGDKSILSTNRNSKTGNLTVYYNSYGRFGSTVFADSTKSKRVYYTYDLPNYLICEDPEFIDYTRNWIQKLKGNSLPLSLSSELEQLKFFNRIRDYLKREKGRLEQLVEMIVQQN